MSAPLVTVILATYNQEIYVENALNSILQQTYHNLEIIICDNGSTDKTKALIKKIVTLNSDLDIVFLNFPDNQNITSRHNHCINLAKGEFISILFGDDYYLPNKIEMQVAAFKDLDNTFGVIYGPTLIKNEQSDTFIDSPGLQKTGYVLNALLSEWHSGGMMNCVTPLTKVECYKKYLNYEDIFTEGEGVFLRIAIDYKFYYIAEPLSVMTEHENNYGKSVISNILNHDLVLSRLLLVQSLSKKTIALLQIHRSTGLFNAGWHCIRTNFDIPSAKRLLILALKTYPFILFRYKVIFAIILMVLPARILMIVNKLLNSIFKTTPFSIVD